MPIKRVIIMHCAGVRYGFSLTMTVHEKAEAKEDPK